MELLNLTRVADQQAPAFTIGAGNWNSRPYTRVANILMAKPSPGSLLKKKKKDKLPVV